MLDGVISAANARHKDIAKQFIQASEKEVTILIKSETSSETTGAAMFSDLETSDPQETVGPFKVIWVDADSARVSENSREAAIVGKYQSVDVVAKFWLEDLLLDTNKPYGETYLDKAIEIIAGDNSYELQGYDRYGLGTANNPYIIAAALRGGVGQ